MDGLTDRRASVAPTPRGLGRVAGREIGGALGCYTLIALLFAAPALLGRATLGPECMLDADPLYRTGPRPAAPRLSDMTPVAMDLPRDLTIARWVRGGWFPNWNPLSACGAPLWAEQAGPFFPLKAPLYLIPSPVSYEWFRVLRLLAAALGAYLLGRDRELRHWPAIAAGGTFELSGAMVEMMPFGASSAICVLPWTVLGAAAIARRRDRRAVAWAAVALGVAAIGGHPTVGVVVYAGFVAAAAGHVAAAWRQPRAAAAIAAWSAAAVLLGLALAAPALLPMAELSAHGTSYKFAPKGGQAWAQTLAQSRAEVAPAWLAPHLLQTLRSQLIMAHALAPAVGVITLVLGIAGALQRGLDAALVAVALLGIALATAPPGFAWIYALPLAKLMLPTYTWALVTLPITQAAGAALQRAGTAPGWRCLLVALALAVAGTAVLWSVPDVPFLPLSSVSKLALQSAGGLLGLALPFTALGALLGAARLTRASGLLAPALGILAIVELLVLWRPLWPQARSTTLTAPPSPAVAFLQKHLSPGEGRFAAVPVMSGWTVDRVRQLLAAPPGWPMSSMLFGLADLGGMSALPVGRYHEYLTSIDADGSGFVMQQISVARHPLIDLASVRYILQPVPNDAAPPPYLDGDQRLPLAYADGYVRIYENRAALPRVRIAHRALPVADQAAAGRALRAGAAGAVHADQRTVGDAVLVEPDTSGALPPPLSGAAAGDEYARLVDAAHPDRLRIEARLSSPGLLVIADTFYPGWRAWVDGVETSIFPADLLFRAVHVTAGTHTVELRYEPRSFCYGLLVSAAALAAIGVLCWWRGRKCENN